VLVDSHATKVPTRPAFVASVPHHLSAPLGPPKPPFVTSEVTKARFGLRVKAPEMVVGCVMVTLQPLVPEQAPPQPAKLESPESVCASGVAVSDRTVPWSKAARHGPTLCPRRSAHTMPADEDVTSPLPFPLSTTSTS